MTFPPLQKYSEAYHYIATSMPKTEETKQHHQMLERVWNNQDSHTLCWWEQINGTTSLKVVWQLIKKLNTHLPFDPAIPTQENWKHMSTNKLLQKCPIKFIHNNQNQPDIHQQGNGETNYGRFIQWMLLTIKGSKRLIHPATWMDVKILCWVDKVRNKK